MPGISNTRRIGKAGASACIFLSALAFAAPAQAQMATFQCEGEGGGDRPAAPGNWTVDIDHSASRVKFGDRPFAPAVITDRVITFSDLNMDAPEGYRTGIEGRIDRLAGTIFVIIRWNGGSNGGWQAWRAQARCRPATTRM